MIGTETCLIGFGKYDNPLYLSDYHTTLPLSVNHVNVSNINTSVETTAAAATTINNNDNTIAAIAPTLPAYFMLIALLSTTITTAASITATTTTPNYFNNAKNFGALQQLSPIDKF
ncbi:hypothetical protein ACTFIW_002796 [Dictyostelium discoideum]